MVHLKREHRTHTNLPTTLSTGYAAYSGTVKDVSNSGFFFVPDCGYDGYSLGEFDPDQFDIEAGDEFYLDNNTVIEVRWKGTKNGEFGIGCLVIGATAVDAIRRAA